VASDALQVRLHFDGGAANRRTRSSLPGIAIVMKDP
jgi:hypothetical protein